MSHNLSQILLPGASIVIERTTAGRAGKMESQIIGAFRDKFILIELPVADHHPFLTGWDSQCIVRFVYEGEVIGFRTKVTSVQVTPLPIATLEYPSKIERILVRKQERIACSWEASLTLVRASAAGTAVEEDEEAPTSETNAWGGTPLPGDEPTPPPDCEPSPEEEGVPPPIASEHTAVEKDIAQPATLSEKEVAPSVPPSEKEVAPPPSGKPGDASSPEPARRILGLVSDISDGGCHVAIPLIGEDVIGNVLPGIRHSIPAEDRFHYDPDLLVKRLRVKRTVALDVALPPPADRRFEGIVCSVRSAIRFSGHFAVRLRFEDPPEDFVAALRENIAFKNSYYRAPEAIA